MRWGGETVGEEGGGISGVTVRIIGGGVVAGSSSGGFGGEGGMYSISCMAVVVRPYSLASLE